MTIQNLAVIGVIGGTLATGTRAFVQESEFQATMQQDMDERKAGIVRYCGTSDKLVTRFDGKLGSPPREPEKPAWNSVSALCTSALTGLHGACADNKTIASKASKITEIICTNKGKGTLTYSLKGGTLTFTFDPSFHNEKDPASTNAASQRDAMLKKLRKDLDK